MSAARLFVLAALLRGGPMHGHQIRREATIDRSDLWADVKPGSLYAALHRLAADELIQIVRTESDGNLPERTVYEITSDGRKELAVLRNKALCDSRLRPDPVDLVLALSSTEDLGENDIGTLVSARRSDLAAQLANWRHAHEAAAPHLTGLEPMTFRHTLLRLKTEIDWHDELLDQLNTERP